MNNISEGEIIKMGNKKKSSWVIGLIIALIVILAPKGFMYIKSLSDGTDVGKVRKKMKQHLYKKYGEEFVVDRIGTQTADGDTDYVARIYPKSIVGTIKEGDPYYYAKAGADKEAFGGVGAVGDGYEIVQLNIEAEKYLMLKAKQIFGNRIKLKTDVKYEKRKEGNDYFSWQLVTGFKELLNKSKTDPKNHRMQLELYLYIFDRIDDEAEKEKRRKQIFDFVQYLKDKGLFEYLKVGVAFIDERVLAPSYREYSSKVYFSDKEEVVVQGETVDLPPMKLRKKMSKVLQREIKNMSAKQLLENIRVIRKKELSYDGIREYNGQYYCWIYSPEMRRLKYNVERNKMLKKYNIIKDIKFERYNKYIFLN